VIAVVAKIFTYVLMGIVFIACGNHESQAAAKKDNIEANAVKLEERTPINNNVFSKCLEELAPIPSKFYGFFNIHHRNSPYLIGQIADHVEETSFTQALKDSTLTKDEPCKQIKIVFSGHFANSTSLKLKISKTDVERELANTNRIMIKNFAPSYLTVTNDFLPDNMSRLPDHYFEVGVSCPSGMPIFCPLGERDCDVSKQLKAKFPDEPCNIKGTDQVFALYPTGQVRINFEGTITKVGTSENDMDEVEIKFTNIEWR
jgi:hypothetical protein